MREIHPPAGPPGPEPSHAERLDHLPPPAFRPGSVEEAFIDPDEPIVRLQPPRPPEDFEEVLAPSSTETRGEAHFPVAPSDPAVADLTLRVEELARALRDQGEAALRVTPDMRRFDATLRAYCVGWLAGVRERP